MYRFSALLEKLQYLVFDMQYIILKVMFQSKEWYKTNTPKTPVLINTIQQLLFHTYFFNVDISIIPVRRSTEFGTFLITLL